MSELDDFVGEIQEAPAETVTESPEPSDAPVETATAETEQPETVSEDGAPAAPETTDEPVETPKENKLVPLAAVLDERGKRQDERQKRESAERQLRELQAKLEKQNEKPPPQLPDVLDDQGGFVEGMRGELGAYASTINTNLSRKFMVMHHDDYVETEEKFFSMLEDNPHWRQQVADSADPAQFVYDTVKRSEKLAKMENVDEWEATERARLRAEEREKLIAEQAGEQAETAAKAGALTPSIAGQRAAGGNKAIPVEVPDPLETTFKR